MKIAYLIYFDLETESGVLSKIWTQIQYWRLCGHDVVLFGLSPNVQTWSGLDDLDTKIIHGSTRGSRNRDMQKLTDFIVEWQPAVVYWRFGTYVPSLVKLFQAFPAIAEINTFDLGEKRKTLPFYKYLYHRFTRGRLLSNMDGLVCVTHELARQYAAFKKRTVVIGNSVDLAQFPLLEPSQSERPALVFLGSDLSQIWHGIDKIIILATHLPEFDFSVIGSGCPENYLLKEQLPENITIHGYMSLDRYRHLFAKSDVGVATLALHRKSMDEACALKVRDYLAFGLPVILASEDTDFLEPAEFILQLPNTEKNIVPYIDDIRRFVYRWQHKRIDRKEIKRIDVTEKEKMRLTFFTEFIN